MVSYPSLVDNMYGTRSSCLYVKDYSQAACELSSIASRMSGITRSNPKTKDVSVGQRSLWLCAGE